MTQPGPPCCQAGRSGFPGPRAGRAPGRPFGGLRRRRRAMVAPVAAGARLPGLHRGAVATAPADRGQLGPGRAALPRRLGAVRTAGYRAGAQHGADSRPSHVPVPGVMAACDHAPGRWRRAGRAGRMTIAPPRTLSSFIDQVGGRAACLAMSRDPNAKVTILLFPPGATRPAYVAKVPTTDAAARSVEREAAQLAEIGSQVRGPVSTTIPKVVATVDHLGRPVLVMTAMPGQSMLAAYHSWRHTARQQDGGRRLRRRRRLAGRTARRRGRERVRQPGADAGRSCGGDQPPVRPRARRRCRPRRSRRPARSPGGPPDAAVRRAR